MLKAVFNVVVTSPSRQLHVEGLKLLTWPLFRMNDARIDRTLKVAALIAPFHPDLTVKWTAMML